MDTHTHTHTHTHGHTQTVDNCYGEFVEDLEPTHVGADLVAGRYHAQSENAS